MRLTFEAAFGDCLVGECPFWLPDISSWVWVDNQAGFLFLKGAGPVRQVSVGSKILCAVPTGPHTWIIASREGLFKNLDPSLHISGTDLVNQRYNDGKVDSQGRLWIGTVGLNPKTVPGALFRLDSKLTCVDQDLEICNGLAFDERESALYLVDTARKLIYIYDYELESGTVSNRRIFSDLNQEIGKPDGIAFGPNGNLFCAMWDGRCLIEIEPDGRVLRAHEMPVIRPTSLAFSQSHLLVTSARAGLNEEKLEAFPQSGKSLLFKLHV